MRISEVMQRNIVTVSPVATIAHARLLMRRNAVRHLPVISKRALIGVVSARDVRAPLVRDLRDNSTVSLTWCDDLLVETVMTRDVFTLCPDASISEAASTMSTQSIGCIPVVQGGGVVGMITARELLELFAQTGPGVARTLRRRWRNPATSASG